MCVNALSQRQKSLALCDAVSDSELNVALFTETWLYSQDDEAYVAHESERRWRSTRLIVHRDVYFKERSKVHALHTAAKRQHFDTQIRHSTTSKQLHAVSEQFVATLESPSFPPTFLLQTYLKPFFQFFSDKIKTIRHDLDAVPAADDVIPFEGARLTCFRPVSEETVRNLILKSPTKSCTFDPIPTELLKSCTDDLVLSLSALLMIPWNQALLMSLSSRPLSLLLIKKKKNGTQTTLKTRPMSNLPFVSKIIEKRRFN